MTTKVEMKAAVLCGPGDIRTETRPLPRPAPGEALVRLRWAGICGSDVHYYSTGKLGIRRVERPLILGHEASGEVAAVGPNVHGLKEGDRVAIEPGAPCGTCRFCRAGRYNLCPDMRFLGTPPVDGIFCEYAAWPEKFLHKVPAKLALDAAALAEPFAVGLYSVRASALQPGQNVVVLGCASVGMATMLCARAAGARTCIAVDIEPARLELAKLFGADDALDARDESFIQRAVQLTGGGADCVFEAAGVPQTYLKTVDLLARGGRIVIIGICQEDVVPFNFGEARRKEASVVSVRRYRSVFPDALRLLASGAIETGSFITARFPLDQVAKALETARTDPSQLKVLINPAE